MRAAILFVLFGVGGCSASPASSSSADGGASPERCATCHMDAFRAVTKPMHVGTRPDTCAICHTEQAWNPSVLNHPWPLTGAHAKASCLACHTGSPEKFKTTSTDCVSCHKKDYQRAPNHVAKKFSTKCASCHQTSVWTDRIGLP